MARAYLQHGYICGYVPIDFYAPLKNGSTRKSKDYKNTMKLKELNNTKSGLISRLQRLLWQTVSNSHLHKTAKIAANHGM